jgi:hypothetical protein
MAKQQAPKRTTKTPTAQAADAPRLRRARTTRAVTATPTAEDIATRAYYRFLERGRVHGFEVEDWLAAEAELAKGLK